MNAKVNLDQKILNALAPVSEQRKVLLVLRRLEVPPDEAVRQNDLVKSALAASVAHPEACITELLQSGHIYRTQGPYGSVIRRRTI